MERNPITFDGSIAKNYDQYLGPFLFEPFAADLVNRLDITPQSNILELACGTGIVTQHLASRLSGSAELTAADINTGMLAFTQEKIAAPNVCWDTFDMVNIPYANDLFDIVVCGFGLMFATDKPKALAEIRRVLKKGGKLFFTTWADLADNPVWRINMKQITGSFAAGTLNPALGPFSMADENYGLSLLKAAGFTRYSFESVTKIGIGTTAADAATGFTLGSPVYNFIKHDQSLIDGFHGNLEKAIAAQLGDNPVRSSLRALVFSADK